MYKLSRDFAIFVVYEVWDKRAVCGRLKLVGVQVVPADVGGVSGNASSFESSCLNSFLFLNV